VKRKVTTVEELEKMTPAERHQNFEDSIIRDLSQVPDEYLARIRDKFGPIVAERDAQRTQ
jgi:hypothetical protein